MIAEPEIAATTKTLGSPRDREVLGWITLIFTLLMAPAAFSLLSQLTEIPASGAIFFFGTCLGAMSVLFYNYGSWKTFGDCMYVCMRTVVVALFVLAVLLFVVLCGGGFLGLLILFVYYGLPIYLGAGAVALAAAACAGGAFTFGALQIVKMVSQHGRP